MVGVIRSLVCHQEIPRNGVSTRKASVPALQADSRGRRRPNTGFLLRSGRGGSVQASPLESQGSPSLGTRLTLFSVCTGLCPNRPLLGGSPAYWMRGLPNVLILTPLYLQIRSQSEVLGVERQHRHLGDTDGPVTGGQRGSFIISEG